jgi:N-acetylmuramoyl-L-alanine amidase
MTYTLRGKCSHFGGPADTGVTKSEDLAFWEEWKQVVNDKCEALFLPKQPPNTSGLARRLDPSVFYLATRWDYNRPNESKNELKKHTALVRSIKTGKQFEARPVDWGPNPENEVYRIADLSPGLMDALGIITDDEVEVTYPYRALEQEAAAVAKYNSIVISSGHSSKCPGASGYIDEVTEARRIVDQLVIEFKKRGCKVESFHDDVSTTVSQNLDRICSYHNDRERDLDISVHFNAGGESDRPIGTEVLYLTQAELASRLSAAIASCGFIDRGGKYRNDLSFLKNTEMPSVLLEICFVDSEPDVDLYKRGTTFQDVCVALADELLGEYEEEGAEPHPPRPPRPASPAHVDIVISGSANVVVTINGVPVPM